MKEKVLFLHWQKKKRKKKPQVLHTQIDKMELTKVISGIWDPRNILITTHKGATRAGLLSGVSQCRQASASIVSQGCPELEKALGLWTVCKLHKSVLSHVVRCLHGVHTLPSQESRAFIYLMSQPRISR